LSGAHDHRLRASLQRWVPDISLAAKFRDDRWI
jgi:hypothetical protein